MKKMFFALVAIMSCLCGRIGDSYAVDNANVQPPANVKNDTAAPAPKVTTTKIKDGKEIPPAEQKELSKEEMVTRLKEMCEYHPDMVSTISGLTVKDVDGKKVYEFNGKMLEDLDKDTVLKLFREASRFVSLQNMQRLQKQLNDIKQINNMNRQQRMLRDMNTPKSPRVYTPPKTPPRVYTPPKTYKSPNKY